MTIEFINGHNHCSLAFNNFLKLKKLKGRIRVTLTDGNSVDVPTKDFERIRISKR